MNLNSGDRLDQVLTALEDQKQMIEISDRLDNAFGDFEAKEADSHKAFNSELGRFIQHIYKRGLIVARKLSPPTALAEAVGKLDRRYGAGNGYHEAYLEAISDDGKGIDFVLKILTEIIKEEEMERAINWQYAEIIDPCRREDHLKIVTELIDRFGQSLPDQVAVGDPARFIRNYRQLLEMVTSVNSFLNQVRSSGDIFSD